jgi:hypothetical protein
VTPLTTLDRVCRTCRYWEYLEEQNGYRVGFCRRYPPQPALGFLRSLATKQATDGWEEWEPPQTEESSWCGEWRAKRATEATASGPELPFADFFATLDNRTRNAIRQHAQSRDITVTDWPAFFALNLYSVYNLGRSSIVRLFRAMHAAGVPIPSEWLSHPAAKLTAAEIRQFLTAPHHATPNPETP